MEDEFRTVLREAELGYVHTLITAIESGSLDGLDWWRAVHAGADWPALPDLGGGPRLPHPAPLGDGSGEPRP